MGFPRSDLHGPPLRRLRGDRLSHRGACPRPVRVPPRRGDDESDRGIGAAAHGDRPRPAADHWRDPTVHVIRSERPLRELRRCRHPALGGATFHGGPPMTGRERAPRTLFAGGGPGWHLYPALALADAFQHQEPDTRVHFVRAERGIEARVLPQRGLPHTLLPVEPIRRSRPWQNWRLVPSLTRSILRLRRVFRSFPP